MSKIAIVGRNLPLANLSHKEQQALMEQIGGMEAITWASILAMNGTSKIARHAITKTAITLEEAQELMQPMENLPVGQQMAIQGFTDLYISTMGALTLEAYTKIIQFVAGMRVEPDNRSDWERFVEWFQEHW